MKNTERYTFPIEDQKRFKKYATAYMASVQKLALELMTVDFDEAAARGEILVVSSESARAYLNRALEHLLKVEGSDDE